MQLSNIQAYRKSLLPTWIRFFSWIFFILAFAVPVGFVVGLISPENFKMYFLGLSFSGPPFHPFAIAIESLMLLFGVAAYGLLWGKRWGINVGILCGVLAFVIPVSATANSLLYSRISIRVDFLFAIPFLIRLLKIRNKWNATEVPEKQSVDETPVANKVPRRDVDMEPG